MAVGLDAEQDRADVAEAVAPQASPLAPRAPSVELLLRLQRGAGNAAVARMILQRQEAAAGPDPNPFENEVDEDEEGADGDAPLGPEDLKEAPPVPEGDVPPEGTGAPGRQAAEPQPPDAPVLARSVMLADAAATGGWREMTRPQREAFVRARFRGRRRRLAYEILADMARATNALNFDTEDELYNEVLKRVTSSIVMQDSQDGEQRRNAKGETYTVHAFGYPFTGSSLLYGARVNYAAKDYWTPNPVDAYAVRRDAAKNRRLRSLPRGQRHTVYGDVDDYSFDLTSAGQADFFSAVTKLFTPQPPHRRSLIHCDYLISLVHMRSFAATLGQAEFNRRATTYGPDKLKLTWDLFSNLEFDPHGGGTAGPMASLQLFVPATEDDFIIGDHVYWFNHLAYDLINANIGNAWRLENTILIDRRGGQDLFLGHGSGRMRGSQLRNKLADEYNQVADQALRLVHRADRGDAAAAAQMATDFPNVHKVGSVWRVQGTTDDGVAVDIELRRIHGSEVLGPHDPSDPSKLYPVRRPIESA
jgi:hypothetical protein